MLYDLSIAWSPTTTAADLHRTLAFSRILGYDVVALNHTIGLPIPAQVANPLKKLDLSPPKPTATASQLQAQAFSKSTQTAVPSETSTPPARSPTVLHRVTLLLSDPSANYRLPLLASAYDLVAIRPLTEKAFLAACLSLSDISIISLDLTQHFPFHFRPKPCMAAVARGVLFEVAYSPFVKPEADPRARATFIQNASELIRATKGRGLILSSEASQALQLRGPAEVVNLMAVWGLGSEKGMKALTEGPRLVVVNEGLKRSSFRGVVDVKQLAERPDRSAEGTAQEEAEKKGEGSKNADGRKKRKGGPEAGAVGEDNEPKVSKRQAKKLKKLAQR